MARASTLVAAFARQFHGRTQTQMRRFAVECSGSESCSADTNPSFRRDSGIPAIEEIAKEVSMIIRTKPNWEHTLRCDFPSFNFANSQFFQEFLKHQTNVFLSFKFFHWLRSELGFVPNQECCDTLFNSLLDAKSHNAAKVLLELPGFSPALSSLELYITCLCRDGMIHDAIGVLTRLRGIGGSPSIRTWNSILSCCLKVERTDLLWRLYQDMMDTGVVADVDADTVFCLIEAFVKDGEVGKGYELLKQVLRDGLCPRNASFNKLISEFSKRGDYDIVSELLHAMIASNMNPDAYTYQGVINGLCKNRMPLEALKVFNDLKDRGHVLNKAMYTAIIHGLCDTKHLSHARQLWLEMIRNGIVPNRYTYNALIRGYFKMGNVEEAKKLYQEMCNDKGCRETTSSCNTMIIGLCMNGEMDDALNLFRSLPEKGIAPDRVSYDALILGFCKEGRPAESRKLLEELLALGLQPSASTYCPLIVNLCLSGDIEEAIKVWNEMHSKGLEPTEWTYHHFIVGLCKLGYANEAMEWLLVMLEKKLTPKKSVFERTVKCLLENDRVEDSMNVLNSMVKIGYSIRDIEPSLICKLPESIRPVVDNNPDTA
ncbi:Pentatricopeptide repeat-containing protein At5g18950 [Linum perenne]